MVRLVMLVALLVANLADAPGISWINYAILVYDIISAAIARFAGLTKRVTILFSATPILSAVFQPIK